MESLKITNFFSDDFFILDPWSEKLSTVDKAIATVATVVLGIFTLGTVQLACGIRHQYALQNRAKGSIDVDNTGKTKKVSNEAWSNLEQKQEDKKVSNEALSNIQQKPEDLVTTLYSSIEKGDTTTVNKILEKHKDLVNG